MLSSDFFLLSAVTVVYCGTRRSSCQLEGCFHCWLNWTNSFPPISQPPYIGNPSPLQSYYALPPGTFYHETLQTRKPEHFTESAHGPLCLLARLHLHLHFISTPLVYYYCYFLLLIHFDSSGYCVQETLVCLWDKIFRYFWNSSMAHLGWVTQRLLYVPMAFCSPTFISLTMYFNRLFLDPFF